MANFGEGSTNGKQHPATEADTLTPDDDPFFISTKNFQEQFGEDLRRTLDVSTSRVGNDLNQEYRRIAHEVREADRFETAKERQIREEFFPRLAAAPNMPRNAGKHNTTPEDITKVQRGLLFNGGVEACDGAMQTHDTLPLTIYQIGVSLVSYRGDQGTWVTSFAEIFGKECLNVDEWLEFLEHRAKRDSSTRPPGHDQMGELVQKAILEYAERAILLRRSMQAGVWAAAIRSLTNY